MDDLNMRSKMLTHGIWQSCVNCESWGNRKGVEMPPKADICIKFHCTPPAETLVLGCKDWHHDIPF